jgi:precorrin-2 dehydrogenase/sirohydrochlorin ferrochelatase
VLPIILDTKAARIGLTGEGEGLERRRAFLAGLDIVLIPVPPQADLAGLQVLFVAGLERSAAAALAARARSAGILVNVEDMPEFCDFHVPAVVRRGQLILTASTGGRAPGLSRRLREWLEGAFGPEWSGHLEDVGAARAGWRAEGLAPVEVSRRTRDYVTEKGWLA